MYICPFNNSKFFFLLNSIILSLILPGRYLEDERSLANWLINVKKSWILDMWMLYLLPSVSLINVWLFVITFEKNVTYQLSCYLLNLSSCAHYLGQLSLPITFLPTRFGFTFCHFIGYVWNSVFDLIWFLWDISYRLRWQI